MHDGLSVVRHQTDQCGVPFVAEMSADDRAQSRISWVDSHDLTERSGTGGHQNLSDSVVEVLLTLFRYS